MRFELMCGGVIYIYFEKKAEIMDCLKKEIKQTGLNTLREPLISYKIDLYNTRWLKLFHNDFYRSCNSETIDDDWSFEEKHTWAKLVILAYNDYSLILDKKKIRNKK